MNGAWEMRPLDEDIWMSAAVPGSVYADLLDHGLMDDPFYRDNEMKAFELAEKDYVYRRTFVLKKEDFNCDALLLTFEGLDTVAEVSLNGETILECDDMHRTFRIDVRNKAKVGENLIEVVFRSAHRTCVERYAQTEVNGTRDACVGFPTLRKAHCMFGWDWGPRLPDAGIWRDVYLEKVDAARIVSVYVRQKHEAGKVTLKFIPEFETWTDQADLNLTYSATTPSGEAMTAKDDELIIENPELWWPNGIGAQPLYTVKAVLCAGGKAVDEWKRRIGLRTLTMRREKDQWGESFEACVNGQSVFMMGADYIPEDSILRRATPERTRRLVEDAKLANYNTIRVWGGGHFPSDAFYDACDEAGIMVWQDFMFACAMYELSPEFEVNIRAEIDDNVRRLRHHASLALWCGNNEMEAGVIQKWYRRSGKQYADYFKMYEYIIPQMVNKLDPDRFYWPSSPSSGGGLDDPQDPGRGDVHYWAVWHSNEPFTKYRDFLFRYVSEFGFQSFPCMKTIESFTEPEDRNIFSYVMEKHQRNNAANGKIMNYIAQTFLYPNSFDILVYASQLLQAEAIRYGVEHWRRNRGVCMGAVVWQLNDCWPVASWSSIDYFGRWKALHYAEKRFFAPVLLSCEEQGTLSQRTNVNAELAESSVEKSIRLNVSNETRKTVHACVRWALRNNDASVLREGSEEIEVPAMSAVWLDKQVFNDADLHSSYASYELFEDGKKTSSGTVLFTAPKHFRFADPHLTVSANGDSVTVSASAYARQIEISCEDGDVLFEDNYFDLNAETRKVRILRGSGSKFTVRSVYDIR